MIGEKRYDIILVTPLEATGVQDYFHLGLLQLATYLKTKGYRVLYFDRNAMVYGDGFSVEQVDKNLLEEIGKSDPLIVGFTFYTSYFEDVDHCCRLVKDRYPEVMCIVGGVHPTFEPNRTLQQIDEIDLLVVGPGEGPVLRLLSGDNYRDVSGIAFRDGHTIVINEPVYSLVDTSIIPDYEMIDQEFYWRSDRNMFNGLRLRSMATLVSSTPCPGICRFCIGNKSKTQHFVQDEERLLAEMEMLVHKYGIGGFWLADRDFVFNRKRALKFAEKKRQSTIKDIPWATTSRVNQLDDELAIAFKEARCIAMCLGLESGSQKILDYFGKRTTIQQNYEALNLLDRHGILGMGSFIVGVPTQTEEDIQANFDFFRKVQLHDSSVLMLMPVVGSSIYDELVRKDILDPNDTSTWELITGFDAHLNPARNYSDIPDERFRELYHLLSVEIFETCKRNRKKLTAKYDLRRHFREI